MDQRCFDLDAYFARIGYPGPRAASLTLLRELVAHHSAAIAFENIDPLARRVPPLDLASVQRKLVTQRRGGYCYEQNTLFQGALLALGFQVTGLMARVRRGVPPHIMTPRSHMLLLVDLPEGPHLADVGYGALTPTAPLRLRADLEQVTPNEVFRLGLIGDEFTLQAGIAGGWEDVYRFGLLPQLPIDYEAINWYTATRPNALFAENLVVTRPTPGVRRTLFNRQFSVRREGAVVERQVLRTRDDYQRVLADEFGLMLSDADMEAVMALMAKHDPDRPDGGGFA